MFSESEFINIIPSLKFTRDAIFYLEERGHVEKYQAYPSEYGIIPVGCSDNGDAIYWHVIDKNPNKWPILVNTARDEEWFSYSGGISDFLYDVLTKKIKCPIFPDYFD